MHRSITPIIACLFTIGVQAQGINNVVITPNQITTCDLVNFTINGSIPGNAMLTGFTTGLAGTTVTITLQASGSGGGSQGFSQAVGPLGNYQTPGNYTFIVELELNGNVVDTWQGTRTISPGMDPDPGQYAEIDVCTSDPPFSLISQLGGSPDPGGTWTNPLNQPSNGQFIPGTSMAGLYTYSFNPLPPCNPAEQSLLIMYLPNGDPGTDGTAQACVGGAPVDLFPFLGGNPQTNGTWTRPGNQPHSGIFNPLTDPPGAYNYTVPGLGNCPDPSATVTVTIVQLPNAGVGSSVEVCEEDSTYALSMALSGNPDQTGSWFSDGFNFGPYPTELTPIFGSTSGMFQYIVSSPVCGTSDTAFVDVYIGPEPCTIGIGELSLGLTRFEVWPNPTQGAVTVELAGDRELQAMNLVLLDLLGKEVRSWDLGVQGRRELLRTLDLSGLPPGVFVVRLQGSKASVERKIVIER
ncbi:MAG: T9SS type A sorting domain-containing protein [Flavobacteriales bacterium]|nr:T9SS type A sorting domain-containing protein [Flavobacteriales bacterium]